MPKTKQSWREQLQNWIKNQHGTAGWEIKLENLIESIQTDLITRLGEEVKEIVSSQYYHDVTMEKIQSLLTTTLEEIQK